MATDSEELSLDVSLEHARAIHRVVRAMNDGECPRCHNLDPTKIGKVDDALVPYWHCLYCGFMISNQEAQAAMVLFSSKMDAALEIFQEWRSKL